MIPMCAFFTSRDSGRSEVQDAIYQVDILCVLEYDEIHLLAFYAGSDGAVPLCFTRGSL